MKYSKNYKGNQYLVEGPNKKPKYRFEIESRANPVSN